MRLERRPLKTAPLLKERIWGGERLRELLRKPIPPGRRIGESWEIADYGDEPSPIASGPLRGLTIRDAIARDPAAILGARGADPRAPGRLPLLLKFLDAREEISIQVHPSDSDARRIGGGASGKVEAWLVLAADPGAEIIHGLEPGIAWGEFFRNVRAGRPDLGVRRVPARPGDVFFTPAGTVHALGRGIVVAEIQQSSDTTYRIWDWGRVGPDGRPRPLHLAEAEAVTPSPPIAAPHAVLAGASPGEPDILLECRQFRLLRFRLAAGGLARGVLGGERFALLTTVGGAAVLAAAGAEEPLGLGESWLLPASLGAWSIRSQEGWTGLWAEPGSWGEPPGNRRGGRL